MSAATAGTPPYTLAALRSEQEILVIHYRSPKLQLTTKAERATDEDALEILPFWISVWVDDVRSDDPEAESAERIEAAWKDPVARVKEALITKLQTKLGLENLRSRQSPVGRSEQKTARLKDRFGDTTVLDLMTQAIALAPVVETSQRYRLGLTIRARLIKPEASRVLWKGRCHYLGSAHTLKSFARHGGKLLDEELDSASRHCTRKLFEQLQEKLGLE